MDDDNSMFFNKLQYLIDRLIPMSINTLVRFYEHLKGLDKICRLGIFREISNEIFPGKHISLISLTPKLGHPTNTYISK